MKSIVRPKSSPVNPLRAEERTSSPQMRWDNHDDAAALARDEHVAEQMRRAAMTASFKDITTRPGGYDFGEVFNAKHERRAPRTHGAESPTSPNRSKGKPNLPHISTAQRPRTGSPSGRAGSPPGSPSKMSSGLRGKVDASRRG